MAYQTECKYTEEDHPFQAFIPEHCSSLLLGTFTPKSNGSNFDFFYASGTNRFWKVISQIAGISLQHFSGPQAGPEREALLTDLQLGLADMGKPVFRQQNSSSDFNNFPKVFQDIFAILDLHPGIRNIVLTSSSKGNSVVSWFKIYCEMNGVAFALPSEKKIPKYISILLNGRKINVIILPSTSSTVRKYQPEDLFKLYALVLAKQSVSLM